MAFIKAGQLTSLGAPVLRKEVIANSVAMTAEAGVAVVSGFAALATSTTYFPAGHVDAITDPATQSGPITTGVAGSTPGSFLGNFTVTSTNQTVALVAANIDISKYTLYSNKLSAAPGTTTGSNLTGYYLAYTNSTTLNESMASTSSTSTAYVTWGTDPIRSSTNTIVSIYTSQFFN